MLVVGVVVNMPQDGTEHRKLAAASVPLGREAESRGELFASTRWTMVLEAGDSATASAHALSALSELCQIYWRPLYGFLRRQGYGPEDAQDLTQGFFAHLIESRAYARADREKGRFRSFLLGALKHFLAHARDHDRAQKRGGGFLPVQLDEAALSEAETHAARCHDWSADGVFEREWAASLLRQTLDRLGQEYTVAGKGALFEALKVHLKASAAEAVPYEEIAKRLRRPATTLRSDVARVRARYRAILRKEVSSTVADPRDVDDELRHLRQAMAA
jgi:RNA polymerase sigma factor (sigma-70 family)